MLAFDSLPPTVDVAETPFVLRAWCYNTPLWCNAFLPNAGAPQRRPGHEHHHLNFYYCRRLRTIGDWFSTPATHSSSQHCGHHGFSEPVVRLVRQYLDPPTWLSGALGDRHGIAAQLKALHRDIHPDWLAAARTAGEKLQSVDMTPSLPCCCHAWDGQYPSSAPPITLDTSTCSPSCNHHAARTPPAAAAAMPQQLVRQRSIINGATCRPGRSASKTPLSTLLLRFVGYGSKCAG